MAKKKVKPTKRARDAIARTKRDKTVEFSIVCRHGRYGIAFPEKKVEECFQQIVDGAKMTLLMVGIIKRADIGLVVDTRKKLAERKN